MYEKADQLMEMMPTGHVQVRICIPVHLCMYIYNMCIICVCGNMYIYIYVCMHICVYVCICIGGAAHEYDAIGTSAGRNMYPCPSMYVYI